MTSETVPSRIQIVRREINDAALRSGRSASDVRFLLATKTVTPEKILQAIEGGASDLGENRVQEGLRKSQALAGQKVRWAMIGHLQANKVGDMLRFADELHSLDRLSLAETLERRLQQLGRSLDVFVQVNTSGEPSKYGLDPADVESFLRELQVYNTLKPRGFMTLATLTDDEQEIRRCFRVLREVRDRARQLLQGEHLNDLSMGMSGDYVWAVEEGATIVRIGQAIFGERKLPDSYYWPSAGG